MAESSKQYELSLSISVIIPTCHRNDLLAKCLDCLASGNQTLSPSCYEVIVTDDGNQSTAKEMLEQYYPWAKWVKGPQKGPAANRNNGAKYAKGEWLVFTDDDCLPDADWLAVYNHVIIKYPESKVFEGRTYADREKRRLDEESPINEIGGYLWSCNFAIKKKIFHALGGFDEQFTYAAIEDVDFHYRLKQSGIIPKFIREAGVCHPWRQMSSPVDKIRRHYASVSLYLKKFPEKRAEINAIQLAKAFAHLVRYTVCNAVKFKSKGLRNKIVYDLYHIIIILKYLRKDVKL